MRAGILLLGVSLVMLSGIAFIDGAATWLAAFDLALGLAAIGAVLMPSTADRYLRASPFAFGASLLVLWVIGLATLVEPWLAWWTFVLGVAYLLVGVALGIEVPTQRAERQRTRHV